MVGACVGGALAGRQPLQAGLQSQTHETYEEVADGNNSKGLAKVISAHIARGLPTSLLHGLLLHRCSDRAGQLCHDLAKAMRSIRVAILHLALIDLAVTRRCCVLARSSSIDEGRWQGEGRLLIA